MIAETMRRLGLLAGSWSGRGAGNYPTIDSFTYEEKIVFELDPSYPLIHYEQRTWLLPAREASHWESGFVRALEDGSVEISNSQDSGRVEVLRGHLGGDVEAGELTIELESVVLDHDPRLVRTRRTFHLRADTLRYVTYMATHTTPKPHLMQHLESELRRTHEDLPRVADSSDRHEAFFAAVARGDEAAVRDALTRVRSLATATGNAVLGGEVANCTALHLAAYHGHEVLARVLVEAGADIAARSATGRTALEIARKGMEPSGDHSTGERKAEGRAAVIALLEDAERART
jgi:hypothetical protein